MDFNNTLDSIIGSTPADFSNWLTDTSKLFEGMPAGEFEDKSFLESIFEPIEAAADALKNSITGAYSATTGTVTNWLLIVVIGAVLVIYFASKSTKIRASI